MSKIARLLVLLLIANHGLVAQDATLYITSDLEGYLVGCECPSGPSAGLSSLSYALSSRDRSTSLLIDAGGFREPDRVDPALEIALDHAAQHLGYDLLLASSADLRDGIKAFDTRKISTPLAAAGSVSTGFGEESTDSQPLLLELNDLRVGIASYLGSSEREALRGYRKAPRVRRRLKPLVDSLSVMDVDFRILVFRDGGSLPDPESIPVGIDLVFVTGGDELIQDQIGTAQVLALPARGNAFVKIDLSHRSGFSPSNLDVHRLIRGSSPEDPAILDLGQAYMDDLARRAIEAAAGTRASHPTREAFHATYWYPYGCRECDDFLRFDMPHVAESIGREPIIEERNTADPDDFEVLMSLLDERDIAFTAVPVLVTDGDIIQGDRAIKDALPRLMAGERVTNVDVGTALRWEPGAVFFAGLLDGVNPCAFTAMVFLVSALALAGKKKTQLLMVGGSYALGVFVTYYLVGAGLLGGLRRIAIGGQGRRILELILVGFLFILAILSAIDAFRLSRGRHDLILKLPRTISRKIHGLIREEARSGAAIGGALVLGAAVAVLELGCTGQVYLPTLAWMISRESGAEPWFWLLLYNLAFIIPLLVVFVVSYKGMSAVALAGFFEKRGSLLKYATAGLFVVLGFVLLLA